MTSELERAAQRCGVCGAEPYLDAAKNEMLCAACECRGATVGGLGFLALDDRGSRVRLYGADWSEDAAALGADLERDVAWSVLEDVVAGATLAQPREVGYEASGAALGVTYDYENLKAPLVPRPFSRGVERLRAAVEVAVFGADDGVFNAAFCNRYADGGSHVSWHSDEDAPLYGDAPVIASVSFGAARPFVLRAFDDATRMVRYDLGGGALLVMAGATQRHWEHAVLKEGGARGARVNVTFRRVLVDAPASRGPAAEMTASLLTGPAGTKWPLLRDAALSAFLLTALPLDLLTLGGVRRRLESAGYWPGAPTYAVEDRGDGSVRLRSEDGRALGDDAWLAGGSVVCCRLRSAAPTRTVLFCSGNAGDLGGGALSFGRALARALPGTDVVCFDYAGFGRSPGTPSEAQTYRDVQAVVDSLRERSSAPLVLFGHSMGASVALHHAVHAGADVAALVLDSPPASILHALSSGTAASPAVVFSPLDPYPNVALIARLDVPVFFVAGDADPICPPANALRLYAAAPPAVSRLEPPFVVRGGSHGNAFRVAPEEMATRLRRFLALALSPC